MVVTAMTLPNVHGDKFKGENVPKIHGRFITFEGGEGCGKSTQISRLVRRLRQAGLSVVQTREPGGSPQAEAIRDFILQGHAEKKGPRAEAMLFAAARMDHVARKIAPALEAGKWVVSDRFMDSTRIYQGQAVDSKTIDLLEKIAVGDNRPDLTFVLDVPAEEGMRRAHIRSEGAQKDRFEKEELALHEARRAGFLALANSNPDRIMIIDGTQDAKSVARKIWDICQQRFDLTN